MLAPILPVFSSSCYKLFSNNSKADIVLDSSWPWVRLVKNAWFKHTANICRQITCFSTDHWEHTSETPNNLYFVLPQLHRPAGLQGTFLYPSCVRSKGLENSVTVSPHWMAPPANLNSKKKTESSRSNILIHNIRHYHTGKSCSRGKRHTT